MDREHARFRDLVLSHEDLEGSALAEAEAHLASCDECRALLARLRELERTGQPRGMLPPLEGAALDPSWRAEADASLRALRARLGLRVPAARSKGRRAVIQLGVPLALAAILAGFFLLRPHQWRERPYASSLRVVPYSVTRGGDVGTATPGSAGWRTGDAFVLSFDLRSSAYPAVFHLGPTNEVELLYPADPRTPIPRVPAGRGIELPPPEERTVWTLEGEPGPEMFLMVAAKGPDPGLAAALADAQKIAREDRPRDQRIAWLANLLADKLGPVQWVEIEHLP